MQFKHQYIIETFENAIPGWQRARALTTKDDLAAKVAQAHNNVKRLYQGVLNLYEDEFKQAKMSSSTDLSINQIISNLEEVHYFLDKGRFTPGYADKFYDTSGLKDRDLKTGTIDKAVKLLNQLKKEGSSLYWWDDNNRIRRFSSPQIRASQFDLEYVAIDRRRRTTKYDLSIPSKHLNKYKNQKIHAIKGRGLPEPLANTGNRGGIEVFFLEISPDNPPKKVLSTKLSNVIRLFKMKSHYISEDGVEVSDHLF